MSDNDETSEKGVRTNIEEYYTDIENQYGLRMVDLQHRLHVFTFRI